MQSNASLHPTRVETRGYFWISGAHAGRLQPSTKRPLSSTSHGMHFITHSVVVQTMQKDSVEPNVHGWQVYLGGRCTHELGLGAGWCVTELTTTVLASSDRVYREQLNSSPTPGFVAVPRVAQGRCPSKSRVVLNAASSPPQQRVTPFPPSLPPPSAHAHDFLCNSRVSLTELKSGHAQTSLFCHTYRLAKHQGGGGVVDNQTLHMMFSILIQSVLGIPCTHRWVPNKAFGRWVPHRKSDGSMNQH